MLQTLTMRRRAPHILAVPNEDGFGPSALLSYVVKALLLQRRDCCVTIWNKSRDAYNRTLYRDAIAAGRVRVEPVWNLIQLRKDDVGGCISPEGTAELIGDYAAASADWPVGATEAQFDHVLEFGVPAAARWAAARGLPCTSLFDHSWTKTLETFLPKETLMAIGRDEAFTQKLFLFPRFIAPEPFPSYWAQTISPAKINELPGVLGGRPTWTEQQARAHLGVQGDGPVIMIQGGDTPAWDGLLQRLIPALANADEDLNRRNLNVVVYAPERLTLQASRRVRPFRPVPGGTVQEILPYVTLLVTRAGGGTVNDAVACRTPFVCMPERGHPQVEAILDACISRGLTRAINDVRLLVDPLRTLLDEADRREENQQLAARMREIGNGAERVVAAGIFAG